MMLRRPKSAAILLLREMNALRQTKVSASLALLFLSTFLLAFSQPLRAQTQPCYTLCRYQGQQGGHFIIYATPIIHTRLGATDISGAFNRYMSANYDINQILAGSGYCETAAQQAYTMQQLEKPWADARPWSHTSTGLSLPTRSRPTMRS
ncbi:MAG TPA: hypothetical protein VGG46_16030 [Terriglobales bacterium]|jgi:hypothetical protein